MARKKKTAKKSTQLDKALAIVEKVRESNTKGFKAWELERISQLLYAVSEAFKNAEGVD